MKSLSLNNFPPAIPLLIKEVYIKSSGYEEAYKNLKDLLPELQMQSRFYYENSLSNTSPDQCETDLKIFVDGGLNLFNQRVGCIGIECRIAAAKRIVCSLGLLGDTIWITDFLTEKFLNVDQLDERQLIEILNDIHVLAELFPLIANDVIRFRSPWRPICSECIQEFERRIEGIVDNLLSDFKSEFSVEEMSIGYAVHTGNLYTPSMVLRVLPETWLHAKRIPKPDDIKRQILYFAVRSALWSSSEAIPEHGVVFSNSSAGMAALAKQERGWRSASDLRILDAKRNIDIPWIGELNAHQILELRNEASKALPSFREMLARHLTSSNLGKDDGLELINELREQAIDTRNELETTKKHSARLWKGAYAMLGLGISAYGLGNGEIAAALGGLLPILQLLIQHKTGTEKDLEKIHRRPGYVLVKARDILQHVH